MKTREIMYDYETENGDVQISVQYNVSKYYPATREQPAEGGEVEIVSVALNGAEIELTTQEEIALIAYIEQEDDLSNDEYFYEDEEE